MISLTGSTRYGRREFLRIGGLGLGGLSLASLFPSAGKAGVPLSEAGKPVTDKAVVFLFRTAGRASTRRSTRR